MKASTFGGCTMQDLICVLGQYSVFVAFLEQGDEVIMFEPFFDQYLPSVTFNGGVPVYVPLHPDMTKPKITSDDWKIDFDELRSVTLSPPDVLKAIY